MSLNGKPVGRSVDYIIIDDPLPPHVKPRTKEVYEYLCKVHDQINNLMAGTPNGEPTVEINLLTHETPPGPHHEPEFVEGPLEVAISDQWDQMFNAICNSVQIPRKILDGTQEEECDIPTIVEKK